MIGNAKVLPRAAGWEPSRLATGVLVAALALAVRFPGLRVPLGFDLPLYATIGAGIGAGLVPYRDLFENKPPLIFGAYWLIDALSPRSVFAIRLTGAIVASIAVILVLFLLARPLGLPRALSAAALSAIAGASRFVEGIDLNTEHLMLPLTVLAVLLPLVAQDSRARSLPYLVGTFGGLAIATKQVAALIAGAGLLPLLASRRKREQSMATTAALFAAGVATPLLLVAGVFWVLGALDDLVYATVIYNLRYVERIPEPSLGAWLSLAPELRILVLAGVGVAALRLVSLRGRDVWSWTLLLWLAGAFIGAKLGRRDFPHYFVPLVVPAATLVCLPPLPGRRPRLDSEERERATPRTRLLSRGSAAISIALVSLVAYPFVLDVAENFGKSPLEVGARMWKKEWMIWSAQEEQLGKWLHATADSGDLFVEPPSSAVYYWASGLRPATRYLYDREIKHIETDFYPRLARELTRDPPRFLVVVARPTYTAALRCEYKLIHRMHGARVLELRSASSPPSAHGRRLDRCPPPRIRSRGKDDRGEPLR